MRLFPQLREIALPLLVLGTACSTTTKNRVSDGESIAGAAGEASTATFGSLSSTTGLPGVTSITSANVGGTAQLGEAGAEGIGGSESSESGGSGGSAGVGASSSSGGSVGLGGSAGVGGSAGTGGASGAGGSAGSGGSGGPVPECTGDTRVCFEGAPRECVDGAWVVEAQCPFVCSNGACSGECTPAAADACNDGIACTNDTCEEAGTCSYETAAGACLINGNCYNHNQPDPANPCRYCDVGVSQTSWTNAPAIARCDDGLWCNGEDFCDGEGTCSHEFASGDRCGGITGECARPTCSEAARSCYRSSTTECGEFEEMRCVTNTCGSAAVEIRTNIQHCTGGTASCDGDVDDGTWQSVKQCGDTELCLDNGTTADCEVASACEEWCDTDTALCWTTFDSPAPLDWDEAHDYCENGTWAGRDDWVLPAATDYYDVVDGCDGCFDSCDCAEPGPGINGCYWDPALGACTSYVTSSQLMGAIAIYNPAQPGQTFTFDVNYHVRCVAPD